MDALIARQPVFNPMQRIFGYELLFRGKLESILTPAAPAEKAATKTISDSVLLFDLETYAAGKRAFVPVTRDVLLDGFIHLLPARSTVVEISAGLEPHEDVHAACRELKERGYLIALQGFLEAEWKAFYLPFADIIKVGMADAGKAGAVDLPRKFASHGIQFLAEKVETQDAFRKTTSLGYGLFQGGFFRVPAILSRSRDIPGSKLNYLRLVSALHQPGIDIPEIESIIRREVSLTYKLLRYLNSAFFGFRSEIRSITHALSLLGERETKRWASLVLLTGIAQDKPDELVTQALVRARFCEAMACASGAEDRKEQAFLMGMLSLMSPILDRPMEDILKSLPVADDVRRALMEEKNGLWHHLESIRAMERGDWGILSACAARLRVEESEIPGIYRAALQWAREGLSPVQA